MPPPPRFFHGTHEHLEPGAVLQPGSVLGRQNWPDKENHAVFMVRTAKVAQRWAGNAAKNAGRDTAHVYEVEPLGDVEKRRTPWEGDEHLAAQARVVRRVSSHRVLNPGREEGVFGDVPAQLAPLPKAERTTEPPQAKGQRALFPKTAVGKPTEAARRTVRAEAERHAPGPERSTPPRDPRVHDPEGWAHHDSRTAEFRRYQGLPPEPPAQPLASLKRGRRR